MEPRYCGAQHTHAAHTWMAEVPDTGFVNFTCAGKGVQDLRKR